MSPVDEPSVSDIAFHCLSLFSHFFHVFSRGSRVFLWLTCKKSNIITCAVMTHPTQPLTKNFTCEWAQGSALHLLNSAAVIKIWKEAWQRPCFGSSSPTRSTFLHTCIGWSCLIEGWRAMGTNMKLAGLCLAFVKSDFCGRSKSTWFALICRHATLLTPQTSWQWCEVMWFLLSGDHIEYIMGANSILAPQLQLATVKREVIKP